MKPNSPPQDARGAAAGDHGAERWTAIVLAGERPEGDPLAHSHDVPAKALIRVGGHTLLERVVRALLDSPGIADVVVLAQDIERLRTGEPSGVLQHPEVRMLTSGRGISTSIAAVAGTADAPWPLLVTTADNALLTPARVSAFLAGAGRCDIALGFAERSVVEARFPDTRRTWLKFRDGHFSGANLFAFRGPASLRALDHWSAVEQDRKKGLRLIASFGPVLLLRALTRTIGLREGLSRIGRRWGMDAGVVVLDAEAPIDVDKPADLALVRRILEQREAQGAPASAASVSSRPGGAAN